MIRPALAVDAAALCDIWNPAILTSTATFTTLPKTQQDLRDMIVERPCLVAQSAQGVVLGFATYGPFRSGPGYVGVAEHSVYVAPGFPRRGIGSALVKALTAEALTAGLRIMVAGMCADNTAAIAMHSTLGFEKVAHMQGVGRKFGRDLDLVLMQKNLITAR